jgi:cyclophilin family peptidyl-prolyl cis-trans isomerase
MKTKILLGTTFLAMLFVAIFNYSISATAKDIDKSLVAKKGNMNTLDPTVVIETTKGTIKIKVFKNEAPVTAGNFLDLVQKGFYNGLTFHRYEPGFVIQGGDPQGTGTGNYVDPTTNKTRYIPLEIKSGLKHDAAGIVAMARANDPNSASCQFYITLAPASFLDQKYAVFGKVTEGLQAVMQLRQGDKMTKVTMQEAVAR